MRAGSKQLGYMPWHPLREGSGGMGWAGRGLSPLSPPQPSKDCPPPSADLYYKESEK